MLTAIILIYFVVISFYLLILFPILFNFITFNFKMVWHRAKSFRTVAEFDAWAYRVHFYQTWAHRPPNIQTMYGVNHFYVCGVSFIF